MKTILLAVLLAAAPSQASESERAVAEARAAIGRAQEDLQAKVVEMQEAGRNIPAPPGALDRLLSYDEAARAFEASTQVMDARVLGADWILVGESQRWCTLNNEYAPQGLRRTRRRALLPDRSIPGVLRIERARHGAFEVHAQGIQEISSIQREERGGVQELHYNGLHGTVSLRFAYVLMDRLGSYRDYDYTCRQADDDHLICAVDRYAYQVFVRGKR